ncbi:MAG: PadR family transcriptional regulator [Candidatus Micrarchaeia archaeon]
MADKTLPEKRLARALTTENLWLYVLSLLRRRERYAYTLRDDIESEFGWKPGLILSYVVLYKLQAEGLIAGRQRGRRKYYMITEKGRAALSRAKRALSSLSKGL